MIRSPKKDTKLSIDGSKKTKVKMVLEKGPIATLRDSALAGREMEGANEV